MAPFGGAHRAVTSIFRLGLYCVASDDTNAKAVHPTDKAMSQHADSGDEAALPAGTVSLSVVVAVQAHHSVCTLTSGPFLPSCRR